MYMISFRTKLGEVSKPYASLQEAVKIARRQAALVPKVRIYVYKVGVRGVIYFDGHLMSRSQTGWSGWPTVHKNRNSFTIIDTLPHPHPQPYKYLTAYVRCQAGG